MASTDSAQKGLVRLGVGNFGADLAMKNTKLSAMRIFDVACSIPRHHQAIPNRNRSKLPRDNVAATTHTQSHSSAF